MAGGHKPRSGSLAFYPRVRAKRQTANFGIRQAASSKEAKATNFFGYKAGMVQVFGKNAHEKSPGFGQEIGVPATVIECPPAKIIGARVYGKTSYGLMALGEATIDKADKSLRKKLPTFKKAGKKKKQKAKEEKETGKEEKNYATISDIEKLIEKAEQVTLIAEIQPGLTGIGKKKSDIGEIVVSGTKEQQFALAKEKMGKEIRVSEIFEAGKDVDVKAVDKGKGFAGVVKRFGVRIQRPKAKKHRTARLPDKDRVQQENSFHRERHEQHQPRKRLLKLWDGEERLHSAGGFCSRAEQEDRCAEEPCEESSEEKGQVRGPRAPIRRTRGKAGGTREKGSKSG